MESLVDACEILLQLKKKKKSYHKKQERRKKDITETGKEKKKKQDSTYHNPYRFLMLPIRSKQPLPPKIN